MTTDEYKQKIIALFKSGKASDAQWEEMANAVLHMSEDHYGDNTVVIDMEIDPDSVDFEP